MTFAVGSKRRQDNPCATKLQRAALATQIEAVARACGAEPRRIGEAETYPGKRRVIVDIVAARGLRLTVELNGDSAQPGVFVLSWHVASGHETKLTEAFAPGNVNPFHRQKAATICEGADALLLHLARQLRMAADGTAFL